MPNRILREGILSSESVCSLSWAAEVFYRRLHSVADDHGRYFASSKLLRSGCYPLQIDRVSDADINCWLGECEAAGLVQLYSAADGKRYIQIQKFGQQVRAKSKFPEPSAPGCAGLLATASNGNQPPANEHLGVFVFEDVVEDVVEDVIGAPAVQAPPEGVGAAAPLGEPEPPTKPEKRATRLTADWCLPDEWAAWAVDNVLGSTLGGVRLEAEKFKDYWVAKPGNGGLKLDWEATWRNWCRNSKSLGGRAPPGARSSPHHGFANKDYSKGIADDGSIL